MLPEFTRPEEFNRMLIYLSDSECELGVDTLLELLESTTWQGLILDHSETLKAAIAARFIISRDNRLSVAELGKEFLKLNHESAYELAPGQAEFLYWNLVQREPYLQAARSFFALFTTRGRDRGFTLDLRHAAMTIESVRLVSLLRRLGVIEVAGGIATVTKGYRSQISASRAREKLTVDDLERLLFEQKMRGAAAEQFVLDCERRRLLEAGYPVEAAAVSLISDLDVAAGYDIESFEACTPTLVPNRFIEVKSTTSTEGTFFWSANELATAEALQDRYWICHLRGFSTDRPFEAKSAWINDPVAKIATGRLRLACAQHRVTFDVDQIDGVE